MDTTIKAQDIEQVTITSFTLNDGRVVAMRQPFVVPTYKMLTHCMNRKYTWVVGEDGGYLADGHDLDELADDIRAALAEIWVGDNYTRRYRFHTSVAKAVALMVPPPPWYDPTARPTPVGADDREAVLDLF